MSRKTAILFISLIVWYLSAFGGIDVAEIKCDFGSTSTPRFSWILRSVNRNVNQSAYQILVADDSELLNRNIGNIWDSRKTHSEQSILVAFSGTSICAGKPYFWKVKVWDNKGNESSWSSTGKFVCGLFEKKDWSGAKWIGYEDMPDSLTIVPGIHPWGKKVKGIATRRPVIPLFRKEFLIDRKIKNAFLFICGLGHYKVTVNGEQVSSDFLSPGWTDYRKTCLYNIYDITSLLKKGNNVAGVIVGNGFHNVNNERYRKLLITYGMPKLIAIIKITYEDGSSNDVITDETWKTAPSPIVFSSIYGGEDYDANLELTGWDKPGFDDLSWKNVISVKEPRGELRAEITHPIKVLETFAPSSISKVNTDTFLYDFGQNVSGIIQIKIKGKKGQKVRFVPGELVKSNIHINQKATGKPYYYEYTLKGEGIETWQPLFTYYGFRYVQVENAVPDSFSGTAEKPRILDLKLLHTYNSSPISGNFVCSNELFNKIFRLIKYSIQSNFQSVLTDCPHREKLGWLEQTYLMGGSIHYNFELYQLYYKIIDDMIQGQTAEGLVPSIVPEFVLFDGAFRDSPEWGSACIILPWLVHKWYGDTTVLEKAWPMMVSYVNYLKCKSVNLILSHGLGDWYDLGPKRPGEAQLTPKELTATALFYRDANLLTSIAGILGKYDDQKTYLNLSLEIKTSFNKKFLNEQTGVYSTGSQTSMAIPLCFGFTHDNLSKIVFNNLVDSINKAGKTLTAGDIGFHFLIEALTRFNASQLIYEMNNRDDVPGYGYQLKKGATALTESWAALEEVSNNHLMLGHLMEWFYKGLAGIDQSDSSVAYKKIVIKPAFVKGIDSVKSSIMSPYGLILSEWIKKENEIELRIEIPVNTSALINLPFGDYSIIEEGGKQLKYNNEIQDIENKDKTIVVKVGSGIYNFKVKKP